MMNRRKARTRLPFGGITSFSMQFSSYKHDSTSTGGVLWNPRTRFTNSIIVVTQSLRLERCFAFPKSWLRIEERSPVASSEQRSEWVFSPWSCVIQLT